ncbi:MULTISPECIES: hypothetical protein [Halorussus]|uniref:DUF7535 family protein n=1 Tax=Halorussus TaxID=1070314 RepID=UPI0013B4041A|nr:MULTISPECIES: hypothetical protein [Halorussus]NHN57676.1 hypothetical protein [Halorussus sp. JP-T4]
MVNQVSDYAGQQPNSEMSAIGYAVGIGAAVLLIPALPLIVALFVFQKLTGK